MTAAYRLASNSTTNATPVVAGIALPAGTVPSGSTAHAIIWAATARNLSGTKGEHIRNNTTCFMRGLAENIGVTTSNSAPWLWRRIVFTSKGSDIRGDYNLVYWITTASQQFRRGMVLLTDNTATGNNAQAGLWTQLFEGAAGVDWNDVITAKTDSTEIKIVMDKTRKIASGNDSGTIKQFKDWIPMNKNLVYDDDESGGFDSTAEYYSTDGKPGMGDVYIIDLFKPLVFDTAGGVLQFSPTSTLYWHEK